MDLSLSTLFGELRHTLQDPRAGARRVIALNLPMQARWLALGIMAIGSAIITHLSYRLLPPVEADAFSNLMQSPVETTGFQGLILLATAFGVYRIGRMRGGTGSFPDALIVMVWLQFLMICVQVVQLLVMVALPPMVGVVNVAGLALFLWLLTSFVAELHGFRSLGLVFGGIVISMLVLGFALAIVLMLMSGGEAP
jgi:hypothetical protein